MLLMAAQGPAGGCSNGYSSLSILVDSYCLELILVSLGLPWLISAHAAGQPTRVNATDISYVLLFTSEESAL